MYLGNRNGIVMQGCAAVPAGALSSEVCYLVQLGRLYFYYQ
jgi:hypothetical protein